MKNIYYLFLSLPFIFACSQNVPVNNALNPPAKLESQSFIQLRFDLTGLSEGDQRLLEKQLFTVKVEPADLPPIFPSPEPTSLANTPPTASSSTSDVTIQPQWGPIRTHAGQTVTIEHLPLRFPLSVSATLNYQDPNKLHCEIGASRYFFASERVVHAGEKQILQLKVAEKINQDLSRCEVASIKGRISDTNLQPIQGAKVSVRSLNSSLPMEATTQTDKDGNYMFLETPPGVILEIQVESVGFAKAQQSVVAKSNDNGGKELNQFNFTLTPVK